MAVGYLTNDWNPALVSTKSAGKEFMFAAHNFKKEDGSLVGVAFYDEEAFAFYNIDADRFMNAAELHAEYRRRDTSDEDEGHFRDDDEDYVLIINDLGETEEGYDDMGLSESGVEVFYQDVAKYWK